MPELSMLLYPWDVQVDGPEVVVAEAERLGVTRLQIAAAYHSAEIISPRRTQSVVYTAEANTAHLPLPQETFSDLACPPSRIAVEDPELYPRLRDAAASAGIALDGWVIAFHNSDLATARPDAAIVNCFGDRFTHGLCPAHPLVRRYANELVGAVSASGLFERVLVESLSYLLAGHGHPHELWGARWDATTRYLSSLCFCEHCLAAAGERGIDGAGLAAHVAKLLHRVWNTDLPTGRSSDAGLEIGSLQLVWPDLLEYTRMRLDVVTSLVTQIAATAHRHGALLDLSAAVWGRPAPTNWMEGVDVARSLAVADGFVLESYFPTAGEVAGEIDHVEAIRHVTPGADADLVVALTVWPSLSPTRADFRSKVEAVRASGVERLALYNYGTATAPSLEWIRDAAEIMGTAR